MAVKVLLPQFGESVVEGTITKWLKAVGDEVEEYEPLVEVNTDKVDTEVPSPADGTLLKILIDEGVTAAAGSLLAWIGEPGEAVPDDDKTGQDDMGAQPEPVATPTMAPAPPALAEEALPAAEIPASPAPGAPSLVRRPGRDQDLGFISPVVARMATEHGLDLGQIQGTGHEGRITKQDVVAYLATRPVVPVSDPAARDAAVSPTSVGVPGDLLRLNPVRRAIADHMVRSKHTSPHVTTVMEADLSHVVAHRTAHKANFAHDGANLTFTAYFVAASVAALKSYPLVNASWADDGIQLHRAINIGMATSLDEGLIVPVIKGADGLSLLGIARAVNDLAERARSKKLHPEEVRDGTFTITNHGTSGSLFATPIINQPQSAILGVGVIQKRAVVVNDAIAIRPMVYLSLTFDHRILDGAIADYFLGKVVKTLEDFPVVSV
jgi:2-oxoglutarate dehydrogenase E2 component (dihydrolipoamide succinyltransferase)